MGKTIVDVDVAFKQVSAQKMSLLNQAIPIKEKARLTVGIR